MPKLKLSRASWRGSFYKRVGKSAKIKGITYRNKFTGEVFRRVERTPKGYEGRGKLGVEVPTGTRYGASPVSKQKAAQIKKLYKIK